MSVGTPVGTRVGASPLYVGTTVGLSEGRDVGTNDGTSVGEPGV